MIYRSKIDNQEINGLPAAVFDGPVVVIEDDGEEFDKAVAFLRNQSLLGFDTETRPCFKPGMPKRDVALLQIAAEGVVFLFRLCRMGLPKRLAAILADKDIVKVGAAVTDDIRGLRRLVDFSPAGFVDLQSVVGDYGIEDRSVKKMAAIIMGVKVSKAQRLTNWEAEQLTEAQVNYAAVDAWICREMYGVLQQQ